MISLRVLSALLAITSVSAHGVITKIKLDGKTYPGPDPISEDTAIVAVSPVRKIVNTSNGPAAGDLTSSNLACGIGARKAKVTADVTAGTTITTHWSDTWPHVAGPIITYLGKCDGDCTDVDATKINFFKIDEVAFDGDSGNWVQKDIHEKKDFSVLLPKNIPNGQYIFRQEILALHLAQSAGGAELYPSCTQINVKGGTGTSIPSAVAKFPGGYSAKDPGILVDIYNLKAGSYVMPGPAMTFPSRLAGAVGSSGSTTPSDTTTTDDSTTSSDDTTSSGDDTASEDDDEIDCTEEDTTDDTITPVNNSVDDTPAASGTDSTPAGEVDLNVSSSSSSVAPASTATSSSPSSAIDTGNQAIEMNKKYASMDASGSCESGEVGCIGKLFAKCDHNKWVTFSCGGTSQCYAVPDAGTLSIVVTCDTTDDYLRRLQLTGATPSKARMVKRHGRHHLSLLEKNTF